jgi:hypothetical protein
MDEGVTEGSAVRGWKIISTTAAEGRREWHRVWIWGQGDWYGEGFQERKDAEAWRDRELEAWDVHHGVVRELAFPNKDGWRVRTVYDRDGTIRHFKAEIWIWGHRHRKTFERAADARQWIKRRLGNRTTICGGMAAHEPDPSGQAATRPEGVFGSIHQRYRRDPETFLGHSVAGFEAVVRFDDQPLHSRRFRQRDSAELWLDAHLAELSACCRGQDQRGVAETVARAVGSWSSQRRRQIRNRSLLVLGIIAALVLLVVTEAGRNLLGHGIDAAVDGAGVLLTAAAGLALLVLAYFAPIWLRTLRGLWLSPTAITRHRRAARR